jgi:hypothetical protein
MSQQLLDWAKQALEMLNDNHHLVADNEKHAYVMLHLEVIERGKALLEQSEPVQEPVAWLTKELMADYLDMIAEAIETNRSEMLRHKAHWMRVRGEA